MISFGTIFASNPKETLIAMKKTQIVLGLLVLMMMPGLTLAQKKSTPKEVKLEVGKTYTYRSITSVKNTQNLMGLSIKVEQNTEKVTDYKVISQDAAGLYKIEVLNRSLKATAENTATGKESYDSEKPTSKPFDQVRYDAWLLGKPYFVYVSKYGKATKLEGFAELRTKMTEEVSFTGQQGEMLKPAMAAAQADDRVMAQVSAVFGTAPSQELKKDATWTVKHKEDYLGNEVFKVTEATDSQATISQNWNMTPNPKSKGVRAGNGVTAKSKMSGTTVGSMTYAKGSNLLISRTSTQDLKGMQVLSGGPIGATPVDSDTVQKVTNTITLVQ